MFFIKCQCEVYSHDGDVTFCVKPIVRNRVIKLEFTTDFSERAWHLEG